MQGGAHVGQHYCCTTTTLHYYYIVTTILPLNYHYVGVSHVRQHAAVAGERRLGPEAVELSGRERRGVGGVGREIRGA